MDKIFFERIKKLLLIAVPSWKTKEALYLAILTGLLIVRTFLTIWLADVNGRIVQSIVKRNLKDFISRVSNDFLTFADPRPYALRDPLLDRELGHGVLQQAARDGLPRPPYQVLSQ